MVKIIIVHYVGIKDMDKSDITRLMFDYGKRIEEIEHDPSYKHFIIGNPESSSIKLDCINPKLLTESEYEKINRKLEEIGQKIDF